MVPTSDTATIGDALTRHYVAHGLPHDGGASDPWFRVHIGTVTLRLPNPPARRRAVFFHDVNHILTGYNTKFSEGETAIAAFEVASGCGPFLMVWFINLSMFAIGLIVNPRDVFRSFVRGRSASSIYRQQEDQSVLAAMSVAALRSELRLDRPQADATFDDRMWFGAWSVLAGVTLAAPLVLVAVALAGIVRLLRR